MFTDKTLMITGGTGSFGNAVLARFLSSDLREIRIFSRDEKKQEELRLSMNNDKLKFYIGDVRDFNSVDDATNGVDYIFHAAALKQVPSCEFYPMEALRTNVLGAENVMSAAIKHGVQRCVVLSTDKAVYPVNAMGITKALMEKVMVAKSRMCDPARTVLCATRYGNVMASRGSVIPLFLEQLRLKQPITITDPKMTRFLMTLEESVDLVLHAFQHAIPGDLFVQKSPASTIRDLAHALCDLILPNAEIKTIGTRHGEKLFETLVSREEMVRSSETANYYRVPADNRDLNYNKYFKEGELKVSSGDDYTSHNTTQLKVSEIKKLLLRLEIVRKAINA